MKVSSQNPERMEQEEAQEKPKFKLIDESFYADLFEKIKESEKGVASQLSETEPLKAELCKDFNLAILYSSKIQIKSHRVGK